MRTKSAVMAASFLALILCGRGGAAPAYERIMIAGDDPLHGYGDPSLEYDENGTGWMSYSAVREGAQISTCLARSADAGKTWTYVMTINQAESGSISSTAGPVSGIWQNEVSTLVHDPGDPGKEWKLYWHKYFGKLPFKKAADRLFQYGFIACRYAPKPDGSWSAETPLFGAGMFPPRPMSVLINLNSINPVLKRFIVYSEPGAFCQNGVLYLSLGAVELKAGKPLPQRIVLIASDDHGKTWRYVNSPMEPAEAQPYGGQHFTAPSIAKDGNRVFLLVSPEGPPQNPGSDKMLLCHRGTLVFEFEDIAQGTLRRGPDGKLVVVKRILSSRSLGPRSWGGVADYDERNTAGGIVIFDVDPASAPTVFQIFNTGELLH